MINWGDPLALVTPHFTVKDCLWLNTWSRMADESDGLSDDIKANLIQNCGNAEIVREIIGCPMEMTSMYRPPAYSALVGGTSHDVHTMGIAFDFIPIGMPIEVAKDYIRPFLEKQNLRMEKGTTDWIHCDSHKVGPSGREFTP